MFAIFWAHVAAFASSQSRRQLALSKLEAAHVLESWALYQEAGRLQSVGLGRGGKGAAAKIDEGLWRWLHVEQIWDERTDRFRELALFVAGHKGEPADFPWRRNSARPVLHSLLELGWGFVHNTADPIPEVWTLFVLEWNDWIVDNPCPHVPTEVEQERGEPDPRRRLISIRVACQLREWKLSTVREWCAAGRFRTAVKHADWCITLGEVSVFGRPKRGRPKRCKPKEPQMHEHDEKFVSVEKERGFETAAMRRRRFR